MMLFLLAFFLTGSTTAQFLKARIINGNKDSNHDRYPYAVSLQDRQNNHFCGGSVIAPDLILTAAHCQAGFSSGNSKAVLFRNTHQEISFDVTNIIIHPLFQSTTEYDHDYSIIQINGNIATPYIKLSEEFPSIKTFETMGWGMTSISESNSPLSFHLQHVRVTTISNEECEQIHENMYIDYGHAAGFNPNPITSDSLCAFSPGGPYKGDSGGPLISSLGDGNQNDVLIGVVSWVLILNDEDHDHSSSYLSVYSRVAEEYSWIRYQICQLSSSPPPYFRCDSSDITWSPSPTILYAPTISPAPSPATVTITIKINLDSYPVETGWKIVHDATGKVVHQVSTGTYQRPSVTVSEEVEVDAYTNYTFYIADSYGDGLLSGSSVKILLNDDVIGYYDSSFRYSHAIPFFTSDDYSLRIPTSAPSTSPSALPTGIEMVDITIKLTLDNYPDETGWKIVTDHHRIVYKVLPGTYRNKNAVEHEIVNLEAHQTYSLILTDSYGDGMAGSIILYHGNQPDPERVLVSYHGTNDRSFRKRLELPFTTSEQFIIEVYAHGDSEISQTQVAQVHGGDSEISQTQVAQLPPPATTDSNICDFCGSGGILAFPENTVEYAGVTYPCDFLYSNGLDGAIPSHHCDAMRPLVVEHCVCLNVGGWALP